MSLSTPQKTWTISVLAISIFHLLRDILQFLSINTFISTMIVRNALIYSTSLLWHPLNTVIIEVIMIVLSLHILMKQRFGWSGFITLLGAICTSLGFLYYWFLL